MSIISPHCESEADVVEQLMQAPKGSVAYELRRLGQEINASFGLQVGGVSFVNTIKPSVRFVTAEGILCGSGSVSRDGAKNGSAVYRYYVTLPTISKEKASANSDRRTRDSVNLPALIRAIKKNAEEPTDSTLIKTFNDGMKYTMKAVASAGKGHPRMSFDTNLCLSVAKFILGVDSSLSDVYISHLKDKFDQFQSEMQSFEAVNADYARYARGVTLVCINTVDDKPHYLVCEATFNTDDDRFELHGGLKRYNSLADSPLASTATMIKTYFQGTLHYDGTNDLGVIMSDKYYPDIDISTGYINRGELWVAIPKHSQ